MKRQGLQFTVMTRIIIIKKSGLAAPLAFLANIAEVVFGRGDGGMKCLSLLPLFTLSTNPFSSLAHVSSGSRVLLLHVCVRA